MNIFISYSPKDHAIFQLIKERMEEKNFHVLTRRNGLELFSSLLSRSKQRINFSNLGIVIFSPNGKGSYLVHQEIAYMNIDAKDHFILDSNGTSFTLKETRFGRELPVLENEQLHEEWDSIRRILQNSIHDLDREKVRMIFHTDVVLE